MKTIQDEILLVIPYIKSTQGNELELALTGWRKYCTSPLRIIVIGEYDPCIEGKAEFIEVPRTEKIPAQYVPNIDVARKLDKIYEMFHTEYDHFVLANDDEYPIHEFDWKFLTQVTYLQASFIGNLAAPSNYWTHDMGKTRKALDKEGKPHVNYCNHHPFYFDMERFHDISVKFNLANDSMIRENLYYNYYEFKTSKNVNDIRTGFWDTKNTKDTFRKAVGNKNIKFICNSVAGYSIELMELIKKYYEKNDTNKIENVKKELEVSDEIIVSFTSWKKRIHIVSKMVDRMLNQTLKPNKIILNLSSDEFPKKEEELPKDLLDKRSDIFEIYWVKENTKVYKKIIPTLNRFPNSVIICIDDEIDYPSNHIQLLYERFLEYGKKHPICTFENKAEKNMYCHSGAFTLTKKEFYGEYVNELYENVILPNGIDINISDDDVYFYAALLNKVSYKVIDKKYLPSYKAILNASYKNSNERYSLYDTAWRKKYRKQLEIIRAYIKNKYGLSYIDLINNLGEKIIVSFTTWKKRHDSAAKMLKNFKNQTLKPDKIYCWLSSNEYGGKNVPSVLQPFVKEGFIEIRWVERNTYCHKRHEVFKEHSNDYVFLIDDDILYEPTYLEELYRNALSHPNNVICWCGENRKYERERERLTLDENPSITNGILTGVSCFPPNVFPMEYFDNLEIRDRLAPKCDDSFLSILLIKNDIPTYCVHDRNKHSFKLILDQQDVAIYNENCIKTDGIMKMTHIFKSLLKEFHLEDKAKQIWPKIVF